MTCRFTSPGNHSQSASMFLHFGFLARFRCIVGGLLANRNLYRSCTRMAVRKPTIHFSPAIPPRNNRSFD